MDLTVVTIFSLLASFIGLSRQIHASCQILSFLIDPDCPFTEIKVVQRLETDIAASNEGFSYSALQKPGSLLFWCTLHWPFDTSDICLAEFHKVLSVLYYQRGQDSAPYTICLCKMKRVRTSVVSHLSGHVLSRLNSYPMNSWICALLQYWQTPYKGVSFAFSVTNLLFVIVHSLPILSETCKTSGKESLVCPCHPYLWDHARIIRPFLSFILLGLRLCSIPVYRCMAEFCPFNSLATRVACCLPDVWCQPCPQVQSQTLIVLARHLTSFASRWSCLILVGEPSDWIPSFYNMI